MGISVETEFMQFRMGITKVIFENDSEPSYINNGEINSPFGWAGTSKKGRCLQCCKYNDTTHTLFEASNYEYSKQSVSNSRQEVVLQLGNLTSQSKEQADYLQRRKQRKWVRHLAF